MSTRIFVAMYAWIVERQNGQNTASYWINASERGLPGVDETVALLNSNSPSGVSYSVSQYHCYFADGGHARYKIRYDIVNAWNWYGPMQPELAPTPLSPKPEWEVQEGI